MEQHQQTNPTSSYQLGSVPPPQTTPYVYQPQVSAAQPTSNQDTSAPLVTVTTAPSAPAQQSSSMNAGSNPPQGTSAPFVVVTTGGPSAPSPSTVPQQQHPVAETTSATAPVIASQHQQPVQGQSAEASGPAQTVASLSGVQVQPSCQESADPAVSGQSVAATAPPPPVNQAMAASSRPGPPQGITTDQQQQTYAPSAPPLMQSVPQAPPMYQEQGIIGPSMGGQVIQGQPPMTQSYQPSYAQQQPPPPPVYAQQQPQQAYGQQPQYVSSVQPNVYAQPMYGAPQPQQGYPTATASQPVYAQAVPQGYAQPVQQGYAQPVQGYPPPVQGYAQSVQQGYAQSQPFPQTVYAQPIQATPQYGNPYGVQQPVYAQPIYGQQPQQQQYQPYQGGPAGAQYAHNIYRP